MEKVIITIGRQFGSGGSEIGKKLADNLNIKYYDKELIQLAAKESGICPELFEKADEIEVKIENDEVVDDVFAYVSKCKNIIEFRVEEPSLNEIFIAKVGEDYEK